MGKLFLATFLAYAGLKDEACNLLGPVAAAGEPWSPVCSILKAALSHDRHAFHHSLAAADPILELARMDKEFSWWLTISFALMGETNETLRWLENAIELGFVNYRFWSEFDPFLAPLRTDPRFLALMDRARRQQRVLEGGL